jgi:flagellar biosynthesis protein FlhF
MSIKRFFAKTMSEALRKVRDALGPEGVILSNRPVDGGIEILALRQDEIAALIPAPAALQEPEAEGFEGGRTFLSHVLTSKQAKANENKTNPGKTNPDTPGYEVQAFSRVSSEGLLNPVKKTGLPGQNLHSFATTSRQGAEPQLELREPRNLKLEAGQGAEFAEWNWARPATVDAAATQQKGFSPAIAAGVKEPPATASRFVKNSPASDTANHVVDQLQCNKEADAAASGKPPRGTRRTVAEAAPDGAGAPNRKSKQAPLIDTRELVAEVTSSVLKEIKSMRTALEQQLFSLNWNVQERGGSSRAHVLRNLLAAGFSTPLVNALLEQLSEHGDGGNSEEDAMKRARTALIRNLGAISSEDEILDKGGIYALVGPTGVGKTTTTAKLAARCVVRHGADRLALLTTDGYRIGGHEQLRIYGKILGVTVYAVKDAQDLTLALNELRGKHMVLIDTVGVGQRDQMVVEQIAMFAGCGTEVKRLLLLNASSNLHTLNEVAEAYGGHGLAGAIITKLDEAVVTGSALDIAIRHRLPLYYVAQGQRVPEDLELANPQRLVDLALDNSSASPDFGLPDTFPLVMTHCKAINTRLSMDGAGLD